MKNLFTGIFIGFVAVMLLPGILAAIHGPTAKPVSTVPMEDESPSTTRLLPSFRDANGANGAAMEFEFYLWYAELSRCSDQVLKTASAVDAIDTTKNDTVSASEHLEIVRRFATAHDNKQYVLDRLQARSMDAMNSQQLSAETARKRGESGKWHDEAARVWSERSSGWKKVSDECFSDRKKLGRYNPEGKAPNGLVLQSLSVKSVGYAGSEKYTVQLSSAPK